MCSKVLLVLFSLVWVVSGHVHRMGVVYSGTYTVTEGVAWCSAMCGSRAVLALVQLVSHEMLHV